MKTKQYLCMIDWIQGPLSGVSTTKIVRHGREGMVVKTPGGVSKGRVIEIIKEIN